ncbi:MAG: ABC transporter ATP-binding protein [Acidimicrobiia bacterium]
MGRVSLQGVTKRFGDVTAVDDLDLEVADREFLVLLGPSGCGKSTVLRLIAGLEELTEGTITIGDRVVNDVEPKDRDLAMVFQSYALYPHLSVRKNIEFPLRTRGVPKDRRVSIVADAAESLGLTDLLDRKPGQLSGGQRQRVALARAIVRDPEAFLMDEPLSNLDAKLRVQTRAELVELQQRLEATVIYVTHDQVEAMTMGDRIAIMTDGVLQQVGPPQDVYEHPANVFVARFIGTPPMNTFPGPVVGESDAVIVGVRPEHLRLSDDPGAVAAVVAVVESLGHEHHVVCRLESGDLVTVREPSSVLAPALGTQVHLAFAPGDVQRFDAASGARLG